MIRGAAVIVALAFCACDAAAPVRGSAAASTPPTDSVEGHGGIAIETPRAERAAAPRPAAVPGPDDEYLRCYALKQQDPAQALPCFEHVASLPNASEETRTKARAWVEKLAP